ncbi:sulfite exporter TauE/SafE family protein [soil metagenome]
MFGWDEPWRVIAALVAGVVAGAVNSVAGGGTVISFPTLLWLGIPAVQANATNAVALWPGSASAAWGFRREIAASARRWYWLLLPSLFGGGAGAWLLLRTPPDWFERLAPWLVIGASVLIAVEPVIRGRVGSGATAGSGKFRLVAAVLVVTLIAFYGGYFGAGIGILLLATLGLLSVSDVHRANGLKNLYSVAIKGVAVGYFIVSSAVVWHAMLVMAVGATAGGYVGAALGRRVEEATMRRLILAVGIGIGVVMLLRG